MKSKARCFGQDLMRGEHIVGKGKGNIITQGRVDLGNNDQSVQGGGQVD